MSKHIAKHPAAKFCAIALFTAVAGFSTPVHAALTDLSNVPLASTGSSVVKPNILFLLDDSGSMAWDRLSPDTMAQTTTDITYCNMNNWFNGVYYDPGTQYVLPVDSTGANYSPATWASALPEGFLPYNSSSNPNTNLSTQFSTGGSNNNSVSLISGTVTASNAGGPSFYYNYTGGPTTTIKVSGITSTSVSGITVNGVQIMSGTAAASTSSVTLAANIAAKITLSGYSATNCSIASSSTNCQSNVYVTGPSSALNYTPVVTQSGNMVITPAAFASTPARGVCQPNSSYTLAEVIAPTTPVTGVSTLTVSGSSSTSVSGIKVNNVQIMSGASTGSTTLSTEAANIAAKITMNGFTATATTAGNVIIVGPLTSIGYTPVVTVASGTDTIAVSGPFMNESQNFANWFSYYKTRIQTMKSSVGLAFKNIQSNYRVGFTTINTIGTSPHSLTPIGDFNSAQRLSFYNNFYSIVPNNSTPLRDALAMAGQLYAHKLSGAADPMQYSCQQNFTIMTTDGMWNESTNPTQLDGVTDIGNQDNTATRPMYDGSSYTVTTKQNQYKTSTIYANTLQQVALQQQSVTSNLQSTQYPLQSSTAPLNKSVYSLQSSTSKLQIQTAPLQIRTSSNSGSTWTAWSNAGSCTWDNSSSSRTQCQYGTLSAASNAGGTCTSVDQSGSTSGGTVWTGNQTVCTYTAYTAAAPAGSCTYQNKSGSSPYTVLTATTCSYNATPTVTNNVASCTTIAQSNSTANGASWTANATSCAYGSYSAAANALSCTYQNKSAASPYVGPAVICSYAASNPPAVPVVTNVSSCIAVPYSSSTANNAVWDPNAHTCGYFDKPAVNVAANSCTPVTKSTAPNYTVGTAIACPQSSIGVQMNTCVVSNATGVLSCTVNNLTNPVASCAPITASSANQWTTTSCSTTTSPWVGVSSCTAAAATSGNGWTATICNPANPVTMISTGVACTASSATAANNWTTTTCSGVTGGTPNTLADTAYYYYQTDLRTAGLGNCTGLLGTDVCFNNVTGAGNDINIQQHMTTFTVGLGVVGVLNPDGYPTGSADYNNLVTGPLNWPSPVSNTPTTVDDLWHAAVNGRGTYFSAKSANLLASSLTSALASMEARLGTSAAASTSSLQPTPANNFVFYSLFNTVVWNGELLAKQIDPATGQIIQTTVPPIQDQILWSAQSMLDLRVSSNTDTRTIYTADSSTNALKSFTWANLNATEKVYFNSMCTPARLSQCTTLIANDIANGTTTAAAASGANLVNYLRGQHGNENLVTNINQLYRARTHVLGDIINSQPQYVGKPNFLYTDVGYSDFIAAQANRTPIVYDGANDGMLHAFYAVSVAGNNGGDEAWAYIPPLMMPGLYALADQNYSTNHRYYVDGTATVGDICPSAPSSTCTGAQWKTILVGGYNGGGRGYYALDVTDPANPVPLWNYTVNDNINIGYTYGNPVIVKQKDGTWIVALSSGYNNVVPGDGNGHLFILNAYTGAFLKDIPTNIYNAGPPVTTVAAGNTTTPNGLAKIEAYVEIPSDNTALRYYGGDLLGYVWRFDADSNALPFNMAFNFAQVGMANGATIQPITARPQLAEIVDGGGTAHGVVIVGTGRYLGATDLANTDLQSLYAIKDNLIVPPATGTPIGLGLVRASVTMVKQTLTTAGSTRSGTNNLVNWATQNGWYVDLPSSGERINVDMSLQEWTLVVAGNVPDNNACDVGGTSTVYNFALQNGYLPPGGGWLNPTNSLVAGISTFQTTTGILMSIITSTSGQGSNGQVIVPNPPPSYTRRGSWRELTN
jgi:type IV pilus assembly protein PilY1